MTGSAVLVVIALGLLTSVVMMVLALRAGRLVPVHRWLWGVALAAIAAATCFHGAIGISLLVTGHAADAVGILMGTTALACGLVLAVWRPAWAGVTFIATGLAQPALLWVLQRFAGTAVEEGIPAEGMLVFYGVPAVITSVVLLLSAWRRASSTTVGTPLSSVQ